MTDITRLKQLHRAASRSITLWGGFLVLVASFGSVMRLVDGEWPPAFSASLSPTGTAWLTACLGITGLVLLILSPATWRGAVQAAAGTAAVLLILFFVTIALSVLVGPRWYELFFTATFAADGVIVVVLACRLQDHGGAEH